MAEIVNLHDDDGSFISGSPEEHGSTEFWGLEVLSEGTRAHFWDRSQTGYLRLCDGHNAPAFLGNGQCSIFSAGNYPKCKRCMKKLIERSQS